MVDKTKLALGLGLGFVGVVACKTPEIYDAIVVKMTERWYEEVLGRVGDGEKIADIGIGTAGALVRKAGMVRAKGLKIVGIDYDKAYVDKAIKVVKANGLEGNVDLHCQSVYDTAVSSRKNEFDATYFSGSFTLLPSPIEALKVASTITKPSGLIYITQTYQRAYFPGLSVIKPLLKYLITIDFGPLTYEEDIQKIIEESGMECLHNEPIPNSVDHKYQVAKLIILKPLK
eukprot:TRINITY_DN12067_c0_g4_i1.p1 TRINITY_DN12067_c0_g4~~TRINITY_DN12067_c0_g4_i1.p1  ORF type:complete len:245 (+),score=45.94 TRINITY_DN12067_c0_g4_i1:46-735(+)